MRISDWSSDVCSSDLNDEPNAFALPGGKVGVYTGIINVAMNQDQLAAVIGHEIGHVIAHHHVERITRQLMAQGALGVAGELIGSRYGQAPRTPPHSSAARLRRACSCCRTRVPRKAKRTWSASGSWPRPASTRARR